MWIKREIELLLEASAREKAALILTGCRQTGKTSLLQRVFPSYNYVSLDLPLAAQEAEESGQEFLKRYSAPLIIDEVQYAPRLFRYLKHAIAQKLGLNGQYFLTGSQKFPLMENITESLAGRVSIFDCHSLSVGELEQWSGQVAQGSQLLKWIFKGGYPELYAKDLNPQRFFSDYVSTYLERDVRQVLQIRDLRDFNRFMRLAAIRTGQLLSFSSFASDLGVSPNTVKSWLSILEASNIIFLLEPYYRNLGKRLIKTPKLYFLDTGLACYLAGIRTVDDLIPSGLFGSLFETHVLGQMIRWYANKGQKPQIYFYRDHYGHEVDFVIPVGMKLKLYECKWSEEPATRVKGFDEISRLIGKENILSQSIITSGRGFRHLKERDLFIEDSVELKSLSV